MWPPAWPDSNPMDCSVWSLLEENVCSVAHLSVDALKTSLQSVWAKIPQETLHVSIGNFRQRIEHIIERRGHQIENL